MSNVTILNRVEQLPIKFATVKNFLRVSDEHDDEIIMLCYRTAIETAEKYLNLFIMPAKIEQIAKLDRSSLKIHHLPLCSIDKMKYHNNVDYVEVPINDYRLINEQIIEFDNKFRAKKIKIHYTAGYLDENKIPKLLVQGILQHTAELYDNQAAPNLLSEKLKAFYSPYKHYRL